MKSVNDFLSNFNKITSRPKEEQLQETVDAYNSKKGNLTEFDCEVCKNKGNIQIVTYDQNYNDYFISVQECSCMKKRRILQKAKENGLGEYLNKRFSDFEMTEPFQQELRSKAIACARENDESWFVALGQSGCGKTLITSVIANYLLLEQNKEVLYITWTDFIAKLKRDVVSDTGIVNEYLSQIKNVEVLFIDELLKKFNETDLKYIIEIINYRYTNNLKTLITSEKTIDELLNIDEATFSRVVEKSNGYIVNVKKDRKKNYRLKGVNLS